MSRSLVDHLSCPDAYPEPRPTRVEVVTTHASWVFLTDREVWKVKRPVKFGFLDYSDAAKRRRACEDEVRLGERLAAGIYRGVVPILDGPHGLSFVAPGKEIDAAVRMERLPNEDSARDLVRRGALRLGHLQRLCDRLADFYAGASRRDDQDVVQSLTDQIEENYRQTLVHADRYVPRDEVETLYQWQMEALGRSVERLKHRTRDGHVREGHGDLRLEHVYFLSARGGAPVVIDPIEFNVGFRCQDVALDVAFLAMDLAAMGRRDLGDYLLSRFALASQDYTFFPLADLYRSHRAWVRCKVACFVAGDTTTPPEKSRRKAAEAAHFMRLALSFTQPGARSGVLLVVGGMIGTGKSTLADRLSVLLSAPVVATDHVRKALTGIRRDDVGGREVYDESVTERTYQRVLDDAQEVLVSGRDVILDGTFSKVRFRRDARALAQRQGCRFLFIAMDADDVTLKARLRARAGAPSVSDAREALLPEMRGQFEPPDELDARELVEIDARTSTDAIASAVLGRVHSGS